MLLGVVLLSITSAMAVGHVAAARSLDWLVQAGCKLPCWRGIYPGMTGFLDAERTLHAQQDLRFQDSVGPRGFNSAVVFFEIMLPDQVVRGEMVSDQNNSRVQYIYFYPFNERGQSAIALAQFVALMGPPTYVMRDTQRGSMVRFGYEGHGFEALNLPWMFYGSNGALPCGRLNAAVGLYLGEDPYFQPWDPWRGFDRQFDQWCSEPQ
jgi:hypothetical protein